MRNKTLVAMAIMASTLTALSGCSLVAAVTPKPPINVHGTLDIAASGYTDDNSGNTCAGSDGMDDIQPGAQVEIEDNSHKTVALTTLGDGTDQGGTCEFEFTAKVKPGSDFYRIQVTHRGWVTFTAKQLAEGPALQIGG